MSLVFLLPLYDHKYIDNYDNRTHLILEDEIF